MKWLKHIWAHGSIGERLSILYWIVIILIAVSAPLIAHESGLIGYGPNDSGASAVFYQPPGSMGQQGSHWLGTDRIGQDVLARLIYGTRTALLIGIGASLLSLLIALLLGVTAGYLGDDRYKVSPAQILFALIYYPLSWFYINDFEGGIISVVISVLLGIIISRWIGSATQRSIPIACDTLIVKGIEIFTTIPGLLLVFSLFAIIGKTSTLSVIVILGLMIWPGKARLLRAEIINLKTKNYIKSAELMGLPVHLILWRHILPNALPPLLVALVFSFAGTILVESTLSFLDLGLPITTPSWGGIMRDARDYFSGWWLAIFPGIMLFLTVLSLNVMVQAFERQTRVNSPS